MSRALILAGAVADARQIKRFDPSALKENLDALVVNAIAAAVADPAVMTLDADGISQLEHDVAALAFEELVAALWPDIVTAYERGAGADFASGPLPMLDALLDYSAEDLTQLLDGLHMTGVRETIHARAWALATRTLGQARRVVALARSAA
jgi:hypothetical protein